MSDHNPRQFDHLEFAHDLLRAWLDDPDSGETRRLLRLATHEFYPEEVARAMLTLATGLVQGIQIHMPQMTDERLLHHMSAGLADAERTT